jgi:hypothetical protein
MNQLRVSLTGQNDPNPSAGDLRFEPKNGVYPSHWEYIATALQKRKRKKLCALLQTSLALYRHWARASKGRLLGTHSWYGGKWMSRIPGSLAESGCLGSRIPQLALAELMLAMSYHHLGRETDAGRLLSTARKIVQQRVSGPPYGGSAWQDWMTCALFLREAEALVRDDAERSTEGKAAEPPVGGAKAATTPASGTSRRCLGSG